MLQPTSQTRADRYGKSDLRRGSNNFDAVKNLQRDLIELGFAVIGFVDGIFGLHTYWAVREFQAYAAMDRVGQEIDGADSDNYADRLQPVATGAHRYSGLVSGVVDAATRDALNHWLDNRWRCPVVVEAWRMRNGCRFRLEADNLWRHDAITDTSVRMFVRDLSGYFSSPCDDATAASDDKNDRINLGDFATYLSWSGPRSMPPRHSSPEGEILPERLIGKPLEALDAKQKSTFKVVRAVSEVECLGHFDCVNAYDNAFISVGPCHWTLGIAGRRGYVANGELCGYLAYLQHVDPAAFHRIFGFFGIGVDDCWVSDGNKADGKSLFDRGQRKYASWLVSQDENGAFHRLPEREEEGNYFKSWHWFYRFVMAGRTMSGYQRGMWDMTRIRLRDLVEMPWDDSPLGPRLEDIFTSEKAIAMLLRWHVRYPGHIVAKGRAAPRLHSVLNTLRENHRIWAGTGTRPHGRTPTRKP